MTRAKTLFTPGPVPMSEETLRIGGEQVPYFRNSVFSEVVLECERLLLKLVGAYEGSRVVFMSASGTAAMEAAIINLFSPDSRLLVVNGGAFGQRFCDICSLHGIEYQPIHAATSGPIEYPEAKADALLINGHETTTGRLYNLKQSGEYCRSRRMLHVVDGISMFVTDELNMQRQSIDALILSSHKGLALPPGLCMVILAPAALTALQTRPQSFYFNFQPYLNDIKRGQTPFTPTVGIINALLKRLQQIDREGMEHHNTKARILAARFRSGIAKFPLRFFVSDRPNAMTSLERTDGGDARQLVRDLEERYGMVLTPNGGALASRVFRVFHMGEQTVEDVDALLAALTSYFEGQQ